MKSLGKLLAVTVALAMFTTASTRAAAADAIPAGANDAKARLDKSPRHGEWVDIKVPGQEAPLKTYIVFPESKEKAPVVIVIHEIFGLTDWVRGVADQVAADGFIAVAPDMISGMGANGGGTDAFPSGDDARKAVSGLKADDVMKKLDAVRDHALKLEAANGKTATVGYCWGGKQSFAYAAHQPALNAAVVYYGAAPENPADYAKLKAPVLGLYAENDERVNSTIPRAKEEMAKIGKSYTVNFYKGAGHGFLRQQDGKEGANLKASQEAWPETIKFFREHTK